MQAHNISLLEINWIRPILFESMQKFDEISAQENEEDIQPSISDQTSDETSSGFNAENSGLVSVWFFHVSLFNEMFLEKKNS